MTLHSQELRGVVSCEIVHGRHDWHLAEQTFAIPSEARK
jgi:hypothetical protein